MAVRDFARQLAVSALSIAAGVVVLYALGSRLTWASGIYAAVAAVVLSGWVLRVFWMRQYRGRAALQLLVIYIAAGVLLATLFIWLAPFRR